MSEKRRVPRLYRRFILRAAAVSDQPLRWSFVTIHDLSASGILFTYDRPVHAGMVMHLKIDFPQRVIECVGRVVRVTGTRDNAHRNVAARFEGMSAQDQQFMENFVYQNLS